MYICYQGRSVISRDSFLTGEDSTWGLSNCIASKGYRVERRRKAYKGVDKAKEKANEGEQKGEHCQDNYRATSSFQHLKSTYI